MSSELQLHRNLLSVSGAGYRENIQHHETGPSNAAARIVRRFRAVLSASDQVLPNSPSLVGSCAMSALLGGRTDTAIPQR